MLVTYLDKLSSFFDRRFIVAYWVPTFIVLAVAVLGGSAAQQGTTAALKTWTAADASLQAILALAALLSVTVLAYLLQALTTPLLRLYEGYWPRWLRGLARRARREQVQSRQKRLADDDYRAVYLGYPRDSDRIRPTRLGNTFTAAEEYPFQLYRLDAVLWWPRLMPHLPEDFRGQADAALTPLLALVNLSALFLLLAVGGGTWLVGQDLWGVEQPLWRFLLVFLGGLLLARWFYLAAVAQAADYGTLIRVAFDLHRHKILEAMHIPRPTSLRDERLLWDVLNQWVYRYIPPWDLGWPFDPKQMPDTDPFPYDTHQPPPESTADKPQAIDLTFKGSLTLRQEKTKDDKDD
ncbi:MAG: hypothetical protein GXP37_10710 [Chloroflexi bacterium]|nr:hypothetical protein [Chloroflexota bacterium]